MNGPGQGVGAGATGGPGGVGASGSGASGSGASVAVVTGPSAAGSVAGLNEQPTSPTRPKAPARKGSLDIVRSLRRRRSSSLGCASLEGRPLPPPPLTHYIRTA